MAAIRTATAMTKIASGTGATQSRLLRISEQTWRTASAQHVEKIRSLLLPGLLSEDEVASVRVRHSRSDKGQQEYRNSCDSHSTGLTALDPKHPVYNFLIEYYGLKGQKGTRRMARWAPKTQLLLQDSWDRITELEQLSSTTMTACEEGRCNFDGILLEGALIDDLGGTLHLKGAIPHEEGVVYSPSLYFHQLQDPEKVATPYIWYRNVLRQTLNADPVMHCHGMHEWAMQYWPSGEPPPPSAKYQQHLPLRVSRQVVNAAVERRGISCTHVDALRYFAPAAGPLNHHGHILERQKQLDLEQPACVHAHMDLLKIALKLDSFCDPCLLQQVLEISLAARSLDIAASPYDAIAYGIPPVPVETAEGRAEYRQRQGALMVQATPVRRALLQAYDWVLAMGFDNTVQDTPTAERYAKAEPGGLPWRKNLLLLDPEVAS